MIYTKINFSRATENVLIKILIIRHKPLPQYNRNVDYDSSLLLRWYFNMYLYLNMTEM